jgi:coenzyme F420-reducing hydrogenase delta subunit/heterodisulfide reductase subunit C
MEGHAKKPLDLAGEVRAIPGGEHLERCYSCGTCVSTCMVQQRLDSDFNPRRLLRLVMMGNREEAFKSPTTWLCSGCDLCYPACPQKIHISQVIGAVKRLAVEAGHVSPLAAALVDKAACFACGTCVEVCPYEAVSIVSGQVSVPDPVAMGVDLRVEKQYACVDRNRCMGCGTCAASCLASCITMEKSTDKKIEIQARVHERKDWSPRLAVFVCDWSVRPEIDQAILSDPPRGVHVVRVPCSGRITPTFLVAALQKGFDGVLVIGCRPGECHYKQGNLVEQARLTLAGSFLGFLGLEEKRLRFEWMPTKSRGALKGLFEGMLGELSALGPIAWRPELDPQVRGPKRGAKNGPSHGLKLGQGGGDAG